ncbi:hypothetical protein ACP70R_023356 [Stipagrostis hirtigluma subsp. patula]
MNLSARNNHREPSCVWILLLRVPVGFTKIYIELIRTITEGSIPSSTAWGQRSTKRHT